MRLQAEAWHSQEPALNRTAPVHSRASPAMSVQGTSAAITSHTPTFLKIRPADATRGRQGESARDEKTFYEAVLSERKIEATTKTIML